MTIYVSLAVSATMFPEQGTIEMKPCTPSEVQHLLDQGVTSALNPTHSSTIDAIKRKFGIDLPIPERALKVLLESGDSVLIIQAQLSRLNEGEVHSAETVENAPISFRRWTVR